MREKLKGLRETMDVRPKGMEIGPLRLMRLTDTQGLGHIRSQHVERNGLPISKEKLEKQEKRMQKKEGDFLRHPGRYKKTWPAEPEVTPAPGLPSTAAPVPRQARHSCKF